VNLAKQLAFNARLEVPLPPDTDLTEAEQTEIQTQIHAILVLPQFAIDDFWSAFAANHLGALASAIRTLSLTTQRHALSTLIQILSLLPDPATEPYFRKFLRNSPQSNGLATLIASAFVRSIEWKRPSGPGKICTLIIHFLQWCDTSRGDDGKACIDAEVRTALAKKLELIKTNPNFEQLPQLQRVEVDRLLGILKTIEHMPDNSLLSSTRQHLEKQLDHCTNPSCDKEADLTCSRCKSIRYCGAKCQKWHWRNGHKLRCFQTAF